MNLDNFADRLKLLISEYEHLKESDDYKNAEISRLNRIVIALLLQNGGAVDVGNVNLKKAAAGATYVIELSLTGVLLRIVED